MEITTPNAKYWKASVNTLEQFKQPIHEGEGEITRYKIIGDQNYLPINYELWELEPGVSEGDHTHDTPKLAEIYHFLDGNGVITVNGEEVNVTKDDTVLVPPGIDHGVYNTDPNKTLRMLIIWGESKI